MFLVIFLVGGLGVYYLHLMADESRDINDTSNHLSEKIQNLEQQFLGIELSISEDYHEDIGGYLLNLDTLSYRQNLMEFESTLDSMHHLIDDDNRLIEKYLSIQANLDKLLAGGSEDSVVYNLQTVVPAVVTIKSDLEGLSAANGRNIQKANLRSAETADKVINYMLVSGGLAIIVGLVILLGFPNYIGNPINEVTDAISDFRQKKYDRRIKIRNNDEFGVLANAFNQMAEQIESYEKEQKSKLAAEETKSEIILNNLREAVLITDSKKNIIFVNRVLESLLGADRDEIVGRYSADIALEHILIRDMLKNINSKKAIKGILSHDKNGKKQYFEKEVLDITLPEQIKQNASEPASGKGRGKVIILKDITDFHQKDVAKTNLISTISHELKTPISSIKMSAQLLSDVRIGNFNDEQSSLVEDIKGDCERLLRITKELVDMSQLESGKLNMSIDSVDAREFINKAIQAVKFQSDVKEIDIKFLGDDSPIWVLADLEKSNLIVVNLLSNAVKYSYVDSVIEINAEDKGNMIEFVVTDHGDGIADEYKEKIFERYYQIEKSNYDVRKTGSGLGLAICKDFVNEQNGSIWVNSEVGKGSSFHFTLPKDKTMEKSDLTVDDILEENRKRNQS